MYPETKGVPLEEMDVVFGEGTFFLDMDLSSLSDQLFLHIAIPQERKIRMLDILPVEDYSRAGSNASGVRAQSAILRNRSRMRHFVVIMTTTAAVMDMMKCEILKRMTVKTMR